MIIAALKLRRTFAAILCAVMCVTFAACENKTAPESESGTDSPETFEINEIVTADEITTEAPTTEPDTTEFSAAGKNLRLNGSITSTEGKYIALRVEWSAFQTSDDERARLSVRVYLDSYAIKTGERNCKLKILGETFEFTAPALEGGDATGNSFELYAGSFMLSSPPDSETLIPLSVTYPFGGTYGGEQIGTLTAEGEIRLYDMGEGSVDPYKPELPDEPFG